jgi:glycosyltransferase involved in cell wall biosynthesis
MNVRFFWEAGGDFTLAHRGNPYGPLMAIAMQKQGITFLPGDYDFKRKWLEEARESSQVLHFNWIHHFYKGDDLGSVVGNLKRFTDNLQFAKRLGFKIVWTFHNLYPHERRFPEIDHDVQIMMCQVADEVVVHCQYAADRCAELFYRLDHLTVVPHGNYIDAYPNDISKVEARERLGISPDACVYVFTGNARPYKGIDKLVEAFREMAEPRDHLVLMMRHFRFNLQYALDYVEMAKGSANITAVSSDFFERDEFQTYLKAADVAVLPFVDVLTSGSAILALSFGLPVILPRLGCLPELVTEKEALLFDPSEPDGLQAALETARTLNLDEMSKYALTRAKDLDWDPIAARISTLYGTQALSS